MILLRSTQSCVAAAAVVNFKGYLSSSHTLGLVALYATSEKLRARYFRSTIYSRPKENFSSCIQFEKIYTFICLHVRLLAGVDHISNGKYPYLDGFSWCYYCEFH